MTLLHPSFLFRRGGGPAGPRRRAAVAVEFAIVAPLLFLLILGMIEFGRMLMVQQILTNAAREGARKAVLPGSTTTLVTSTIDTYLTNSKISGHSRTVTPDPSSASTGGSLTVTVSVPYSSVSWVPLPRFLGSQTLTASVVMRKEED